MGKNYKQSTLDALNKFSQKAMDENKPKEVTRRHEKPEKEVEKLVLSWCRHPLRNWNIQVFESKATWSTSQGCWTQQGMKAGTCDLMGTIASSDENLMGISVAIELKAKGKLSTFNRDKNYLQRKFIVDKINSGAFACVIDTVERLETIFNKWVEIRTTDKAASRQYLISMLPAMSVEKKLKEERLFDDE